MQREPASFRDPSGYVFRDGGFVKRWVAPGYVPSYDRLMQSGLYAELTAKGWLLAHDEEPSTGAHRVLRPQQLGFVSYPHEWSFSMLKDACLLTLEIQKLALKHDMVLKDASAYNVQFHLGKPVFIDTLSFEPYTVGSPWVAYKQFCQHFLAPLALMAFTDIRLSQLLRTHIDGIPLDLASKLLPWRSWFRPGLLMHVHLHARMQSKYAGAGTKPAVPRKMPLQSLLGVIDSLEGTVKGLQMPGQRTEWEDYYKNHNYSEAGFKEKGALVRSFVTSTGAKKVWDFGGNRGDFSRIAGETGADVVCWDIDPNAVETNYRRVRGLGETNLLPLVLDLTNPSSPMGWGENERQGLLGRKGPDALMALALIHHLVISNNVPFSMVSSYFRALAPWLVIEFVPKGDSQVNILLATRQDVFGDYDEAGFEKGFASDWEIVDKKPVAGSTRTLYLLKGR